MKSISAHALAHLGENRIAERAGWERSARRSRRMRAWFWNRLKIFATASWTRRRRTITHSRECPLYADDKTTATTVGHP
jgi:hypothetical protein